MESELILDRGGFPPLSARGCTQHLIPIGTGILRRTINGTLVYAGNTLAHKYRSVISCEDKASLALEGLWRGSEVRVGCIQHLWRQSTDKEVLLERDPVEGSVFAATSIRENVEIQNITGRKVALVKGGLEKVFVAYRPWLEMRVTSFTLMTDEWNLKAGWRLELEEV